MLYVIITTHPRYIEARERILASLKNVGWPLNRIIIVIGEQPSESIQISQTDITIIHLVHNLYEYNAFIAANLFPEYDATFLLIHDTCDAQQGFVEKVWQQYESVDFANQPCIYWLSPKGQCNICMFNQHAAKCIRPLLEKSKTMDKVKAIEKEWNKSWYPKWIVQIFCNVHTSHKDKQPTYSSGILRNTITYNSINLLKHFQPIQKNSDHKQQP